MRDKKGRRLHYHNIKAILGIEDSKEEGWDLPDDISELEEGDGPETSEPVSLIDQIFTEDGIARVDVKFDGKPTKRYMDPRQLLNIQQGAGGGKSEIIHEKVRYVEPQTPETPMVEFPGPASGNDRQRKGSKTRPRKTPPDWEFETSEKPEIPEDWTDSTKPIGADKRGHKGKHRYKKGGNFVVTEDGEIIWTE
jgi:hypothetical protein